MAPPSKKYQTTGSKAYPEFLGDHRDQRGFLAWCSLWLPATWRATREGGVLVTFIDWRMLPTMTDAVQAGGWIWRGIPATAGTTCSTLGSRSRCRRRALAVVERSQPGHELGEAVQHQHDRRPPRRIASDHSTSSPPVPSARVWVRVSRAEGSLQVQPTGSAPRVPW